MMLVYLKLAIVVVILIPLGWSAMLAIARALGRANPQRKVATERSEQIVLLMMVAPTLVGLWLIGMVMLAPDAVSVLSPSIRITLGQPSVIATQDPRSFPNLATCGALGAALLYLVGALRLFLRFLQSQSRLRRIISGSTDAGGMWGKGVSVTVEDVPPFASGTARIVLPRQLMHRLSPEQIALVVRHERAHLLRRDPRRFVAFALIEIALWFNPVVRRQIERCRLAAELACDAEATKTMPAMRKAYAEALVLALKHATADPMFCAAAVIPTGTAGDYHMRIAEIMRPSTRRPAWTPFVTGLLLSAPLALFQASLAGAVPLHKKSTLELQLSSARAVADRIETTKKTTILDGHATLHQSGIDVRANLISLTAYSAADYAMGRFQSLLAEGAAEVRVSNAGQKTLGGAIKFTGDQMQREGSELIVHGPRVKIESATQ